jgi:hypothetical protein
MTTSLLAVLGLSPSCAEPEDGADDSTELPPPYGGFPHDAEPVDWFTDVTDQTGISALHMVRGDDLLFSGNGVAAGDVDGDGRIDILATRGNGAAALYRNIGKLEFEDVSDASGIDTDFPARLAALGDMDADGDIDIVLAGDEGTRIYYNAGDGRFELGTATGLDAGPDGQTLLLLDFDNDGMTDILVAEARGPGSSSRGHLYRNRGDGTYENVWDALGLPEHGYTWVVTASDYDNDGDIDLLFGNDTFIPDTGARPVPGSADDDVVPDLLYRNDGFGATGLPTYTEVGGAAGIREYRSTMGIIAADFSGDGIVDLYYSDWGRNDLLVGNGDGTFSDRSADYDLGYPRRNDAECECLLVSWGSAKADFDLDGNDDLVVVNSAFPGGDTRQPAIVWRGTADAGYVPVQTGLGWLSGRALVPADLDEDGDLDLLVTTWEGPLRVFRNDRVSANGWLRVRLHGTVSNPDGLGAGVTVTLTSGRTIRRDIGTGGVVHSWAPNEAHFGLGGDSIASLEVSWPSGNYQRLDAVDPNREIEIWEPVQ